MDYTEIDALMASQESADRRMAATMLGESGDDAAVERLVRLLKDSNSGVRDAAQSSLMLMGGKRAVELVAPLVAEIDPGLRNAAIDILRKIGDDGIDVLHRLAVDENDDIRLFVLDILGTIGNPESVDVLIGGLRDADANIRNAAVVSLGLLGDTKAFEHLKALIDDEEWIRFSAIEAMSHLPHEGLPAFLLEQLQRWGHDELTISALLETIGKIRAKQCVEPLVAMLENASAYVETEIVKALLKILSPGEIAGLARRQSHAIKAVIDMHLADADDELLGEMLSALSRIGDRASVQALVDLARATDPDTQAERLAAVTDALCSLGDTSAMLELLDGEDKLKILAADVLGRIGSEREAGRICEIIHSSQGYVKRALADALAAIGGASLREEFHRLLEDTDGHVISAAMQALAKFGDPEDLGVIEPFLSHRYPDVREAALDSVIRIGTERGQEVFVRMLDKADPAVMTAALNGLDRMGSPRLGEMALRLLKDSHWEVRAAALAVIRDRDLDIPPSTVRDLLVDDHEQIRFAAIDIVGLKRMGDLRPVLEDAIAGDNMWAASHAIESLGMFRDREAKQRLLGIIASGSDFLRISAIRTLAGWEDEALAAELEPYQDDANPDVARAAIDAIDRLQGVSF
ncbi:MAG TPA: HEAT repeat domain-containing protein [Deltaproteobacteria bacterium]|nr:HEAT repeat domain-containing protein [Deltaproteobacteria bacterium]